MNIRPEKSSDYAAIRAINIAAFAIHPFSRQTEHLIVEALREAGALEVSLVAESDGNDGFGRAGEVVGTIAFSKAGIGGADVDWCMAGPLAVMPDVQRKGVGSALVRAGLAAIRAMGAKGCVLVGDSAFYGRFGFGRIVEQTMEGVPEEYILGLRFTGGIPHGEITHHPAFMTGL